MTAPLDPRDAIGADVYKAGHLAATLTRTETGVRFAYTPEYLDADGRAVATTLPLTDEPITTTGGAVPAFFANLLPEGRRLTGLRHAMKTSADDEFTLLLAVGEDPAGDVAILPSGQLPTPAASSGPTVDADFADVSFTEILASSEVDPTALAGVQDKVSGRMITTPLVHGGMHTC